MARRRRSADQDAAPPDGAPGAAGGSGPSASGYGPPGYAGPPGFRPGDVEPAGTLKKARTGLIVFTAFLVELVLIAAGANQAVYKHVVDYAGRHETTLLGNGARASLVYTWRVSAPSGDNRGGVHVWWSELATVGAVLLLTVLLTVVLVRGQITFLRAFFGVWLTVIVATGVARIVALLVSPADVTEPSRVRVTFDFIPNGDLRRYADNFPLPAQPSVSDRITSALFNGPSADAFVAGLVLGFVVALIAAIVAVSSRRALPLAVVPGAADEPLPPTPEPPPPYYGNAPEARPAPAAQPRSEQDDRATTALPSFANQPRQDESGRTAEFPQVPNEQVPDKQVPDQQVPDQQVPDQQVLDEQGRTTQVPRYAGISGSTPPDRSTPSDRSVSDDRTQSFPRPPDDEDLGHHDD